MEKDAESITWIRGGYCNVRGTIKTDPSKNAYVGRFSVYDNGVHLGTIDPITEEGIKTLEKFDGKYVEFRSFPPCHVKRFESHPLSCVSSETVFFLHI